jgi:hypothetical protein
MVDWVHERDRLLTRDIPAEDAAVVWRVLGTMREQAQAMLEEEQRLGS